MRAYCRNCDRYGVFVWNGKVWKHYCGHTEKEIESLRRKRLPGATRCHPHKYGDIVRLVNGLSARVLIDHGETLRVAIIISGWGDPHRTIRRTDIAEAA
jgi:hypothetical protein